MCVASGGTNRLAIIPLNRMNQKQDDMPDGRRDLRRDHGGSGRILNTNFDKLVKSPQTVTPAKAGVQNYSYSLDSCLHGNDKGVVFFKALTFLLHQFAGSSL